MRYRNLLELLWNDYRYWRFGFYYPYFPFYGYEIEDAITSKNLDELQRLSDRTTKELKTSWHEFPFHSMLMLKYTAFVFPLFFARQIVENVVLYWQAHPEYSWKIGGEGAIFYLTALLVTGKHSLAEKELIALYGAILNEGFKNKHIKEDHITDASDKIALVRRFLENFSGDNDKPISDLYAPITKPTITKTKTSIDLEKYLNELEHWALENKKEARGDWIAFWAFKLPAIIASASAGIWAFFGLPVVSLILGAIATICIIIDGIHPRGLLRNIHLRAFHEIRDLESKIANQWRSSEKTAAYSRKLIEEAEGERTRIATYIKNAETNIK